jgi:hypothetical protein
MAGAAETHGAKTSDNKTLRVREVMVKLKP